MDKNKRKNKRKDKKFLPFIYTDDVKRNLIFNQDQLNVIAEVVLGESVGEIKYDEMSEAGHIGSFSNLSVADLQRLYMVGYIYDFSEYYALSYIMAINNMDKYNYILPSANLEYIYHFEVIENEERLERGFDEITYYDKQLHVVWKKEIIGSGNSEGYVNYTEDYLYLSIDNMVYTINNETGEDMIETVSIGVTGRFMFMETRFM